MRLHFLVFSLNQDIRLQFRLQLSLLIITVMRFMCQRYEPPFLYGGFSITFNYQLPMIYIFRCNIIALSAPFYSLVVANKVSV